MSQRPYNYVHLPWAKLAVVNFTRSEECNIFLQMMDAIAGLPGVCVAGVRRAAHQGLEGNLAHFCAKRSHSSSYANLPLVFVGNELVPLEWACKRFVSHSLFQRYISELEASRAPQAPASIFGCARDVEAWARKPEGSKLIFHL